MTLRPPCPPALRGAALLTVAALLTAAGCTSSRLTGLPASDPSAIASSTAATAITAAAPSTGGGPATLGPVPAHAVLAVPFSYGGVRFTVTRVTLHQRTLPHGRGVDGPTPDNGQFIVIALQATNRGPSAVRVATIGSTLIDNRRRRYTSDIRYVTASNPLDVEVQPDTSRTGWLAFDVPASVTAAETLLFRPFESGPATPVALTRPARPRPTRPATTPPAAPVLPDLFCKVLRFSPDDLQYEVTPGTSTYRGLARVTLTESDRGIVFPVHPVVRVAAAGSAANWHPVPPDDVGASAAPDSCTATGLG